MRFINIEGIYYNIEHIILLDVVESDNFRGAELQIYVKDQAIRRIFYKNIKEAQKQADEIVEKINNYTSL